MYDLTDLMHIYHMERDTSAIQPLPENFRTEVKAYLERLKIEKRDLRDFEATMRIDDEIRSVKIIIHDLEATRYKKVHSFAAIDAAGTAPTPEQLKGMTPDEKRAYDALRAAMREARSTIKLWGETYNG